MDLDLRRLLFGTVGRDGDTLAAFVEDLKLHGGETSQIRDVCSDLSPAFIKGIRENLPKAEITFDRFHLMKLMNEALDAVRREESLSTPGLKKTRYHWLKNPGDLTQSQKKRLLELKAMNLQTVEAYQMKLLFQDFFEQTNPRAAKLFLADWCILGGIQQQFFAVWKNGPAPSSRRMLPGGACLHDALRIIQRTEDWTDPRIVSPDGARASIRGTRRVPPNPSSSQGTGWE